MRQAHPVAAAAKEAPGDLDTKHLEVVIGAKDDLKDGVFKFTLGRPDVPVKCTRCGGLKINVGCLPRNAGARVRSAARAPARAAASVVEACQMHLLRFSDSFPDANALLAERSRRGLEGIVAKRKELMGGLGRRKFQSPSGRPSFKGGLDSRVRWRRPLILKSRQKSPEFR